MIVFSEKNFISRRDLPYYNKKRDTVLIVPYESL